MVGFHKTSYSYLKGVYLLRVFLQKGRYYGHAYATGLTNKDKNISKFTQVNVSLSSILANDHDHFMASV